MSRSINVSVRIRPTFSNEISSKQIRVVGDKIELTQSDKNVSKFNFDSVFTEDYDQDQMYDTIGLKVKQNALKGFNGTIIGYGQSGSGKTHTLQGNDKSGESGLVPRLFDDLKTEIDQNGCFFNMEFAFQMVQIYLEKVYDLRTNSTDPLEIRSTPQLKGQIKNLAPISSKDPIMLKKEYYKAAHNRNVGSTKLNSQSSRSHCVTILTITRTEISTHITTISTLYLVDLAGSECVGQTGAEGQRLEEAKNINKSLTSLSMVIQALCKSPRPAHIPYRDSKLTMILENSFGGNSLTYLILNISKNENNLDQTLSTLRFGASAKTIKNKITKNTIETTADLLKYKAMYMELLETTKTLHNSGSIPENMILKIDYEELENKLSEAESTLGTISLENQQLKEICDTQSTKLKELDNPDAPLNKLIKKKDKEINDYKMKLESHNQTMEEVLTEIQVKKSELDMKATQIGELITIRDSLQLELNNHKDCFAIIGQKEKEIEDLNIKLKENRKSFDEQITNLNNTIKTKESIIKDLDTTKIELMNQLVELQDKKREVETGLHKKEVEFLEISSEHEHIKNKTEILQQQLFDNERTISQLEDKVKSMLTTATQNLSSSIKITNSDDPSDFNLVFDTLKNEREKLKRTIKNMNDQIDLLNNDIKLKDKNILEFKNKITSLSEESNKFLKNKEIDDNKNHATIQNLQDEIETFKNQIITLKKTINENEEIKTTEITHLTHTNNEYLKEVESFKYNIAQLQELKTNNMKESDKKLSELNNKIESLMDECRKYQENIDTYKSQILTYTSTIDELTRTKEEQTFLLSQKENDIKVLKLNLSEVNSLLTQKSNELSLLLQDNQEILSKIEVLQKELEKLRDVDTINKQYFGEIQELEKKNSRLEEINIKGTQTYNLEKEKKISMLNDEINSLNKKLELQIKLNKEEALQNKNYMNENATLLKEIDQLNVNYQQHIVEYEHLLSANTFNLNEIRSENQYLNDTINNLQHDISTKEQQIEDLSHQISANLDLINNLESQNEQLHSELLTKDNLLIQLNETKTKLIYEFEQETSEMECKYNDINILYNELKNEHEILVKKFNDMKDNYDTQLDNKNKDINEKDKNIEEIKKQFEILNANSQKLYSELHTLYQGQNSANLQSSSSIDGGVDLKQSININNLIVDQKNAINKYQNIIADKTVEIETLNSKLLSDLSSRDLSFKILEENKTKMVNEFEKERCKLESKYNNLKNEHEILVKKFNDMKDNYDTQLDNKNKDLKEKEENIDYLKRQCGHMKQIYNKFYDELKKEKFMEKKLVNLQSISFNEDNIGQIVDDFENFIGNCRTIIDEKSKEIDNLGDKLKIGNDQNIKVDVITQELNKYRELSSSFSLIQNLNEINPILSGNTSNNTISYSPIYHSPNMVLSSDNNRAICDIPGKNWVFIDVKTNNKLFLCISFRISNPKCDIKSISIGVLSPSQHLSSCSKLYVYNLQGNNLFGTNIDHNKFTDKYLLDELIKLTIDYKESKMYISKGHQLLTHFSEIPPITIPLILSSECNYFDVIIDKVESF